MWWQSAYQGTATTQTYQPTGGSGIAMAVLGYNSFEAGSGISLPGHCRHPDHINQQEEEMAEMNVPHKGTTGKGTILTLDLGSKTGWALRQTDGTITSGTVEFRPGRFEGGGMTFVRFKNWLNEVNRFAGPIAGIWFEEVMSHVGTIAAQTYGSFHGHLTAWAEEQKIPYRGVPVGTIKRHATGKGNAPKIKMIEAMRQKGHTPADDNAADALAIMYWALDEEVAK